MAHPAAMPFYEYQCNHCGHVVELLQGFDDPPPGACPKGDGGDLKRILSAHSVGGVASGSEGAFCQTSEAPDCGGCGRAGTGCS